MISYKWTIEKVTVTTDNAVTHVYWRCDASQDDLKASCAGVRTLVRSDTFIPYEQLTEQQVLDWCFAPEVTTWKDVDGNEQSSTRLIKDEGEAQVAGQIARQLAQKTAEPALPWANVE
jgi:hypothetical protein